jgi:poly(3-hydroxybutyrate) depolymerase
MRWIVVAVLAMFLFLTASVVTFAKGKVTKETVISGNKKRTYYLFIPDSISSARPAPLIVLLHGSNRDGMSLVDKWKDIADKERIVLAGPNSINSSGWGMPEDGPEFLYDLVESLRAKYPINQLRLYLFGHSAGASFALEISLMESEYFAATAVHAGALPAEAYSFTDYSKRKIPLAIFVGDKDESFPLTVVLATTEMLKTGGFPVVLNEIPNHNHWYYDLAPEINRGAWEFLKNHELPNEPRYQQIRFKK